MRSGDEPTAIRSRTSLREHGLLLLGGGDDSAVIMAGVHASGQFLELPAQGTNANAAGITGDAAAAAAAPSAGTRAYLEVSAAPRGYGAEGVYTNGRYRELGSPRTGSGSRENSAERSHGAGAAPCGIMKVGWLIKTLNAPPPNCPQGDTSVSVSLCGLVVLNRSGSGTHPGSRSYTSIKPIFSQQQLICTSHYKAQRVISETNRYFVVRLQKPGNLSGTVHQRRRDLGCLL